jgi:hypothetical protein
VWELIFLMVVMKIPIIYLCWVVWWAIKAEPRPPEGAPLVAQISPDGSPGGFRWHRRRSRRPRPLRPHGGPTRAYARTARAAPVGSRR